LLVDQAEADPLVADAQAPLALNRRIEALQVASAGGVI